jgi:ABC-type hemin transport system ATPase subunit
MSQQPELGFPLMVDEVVMMGRYPHFAFTPGKKIILSVMKCWNG